MASPGDVASPGLGATRGVAGHDDAAERRGARRLVAQPERRFQAQNAHALVQPAVGNGKRGSMSSKVEAAHVDENGLCGSGSIGSIKWKREVGW